MRIELHLRKVKEKLEDIFENDMVQVFFNYNPENRVLFWGLDYPLSKSYLTFSWVVPEENLQDFYDFMLSAIITKMTQYIKDVSARCGYEHKAPPEYI